MNPVPVSIGLAKRWPRFARFATRCSFWIRYPSVVFGVFRGISFAYCDAAAAVAHALNSAVYCVLSRLLPVRSCHRRRCCTRLRAGRGECGATLWGCP